jgi:hypothetical protein
MSEASGKSLTFKDLESLNGSSKIPRNQDALAR